jgi:hypothetical protein
MNNKLKGFVVPPTDLNTLINHFGGAAHTPKNMLYFELVTLDYLIGHVHYLGETQDPEANRMYKQYGGLAYLVMRLIANPQVLSKEKPNPEFIIDYVDPHGRMEINVMRYCAAKDIYEPIVRIKEDPFGEWVVKALYDKATITDFLIYAAGMLIK